MGKKTKNTKDISSKILIFFLDEMSYQTGFLDQLSY